MFASNPSRREALAAFLLVVLLHLRSSDAGHARETRHRDLRVRAHHLELRALAEPVRMLDHELDGVERGLGAVHGEEDFHHGILRLGVP